MSRVVTLSALVILVWLSLIFGLFIILKIVFELTLPWQEQTPIAVAVMRVCLSLILTVVWLFLWRRIAQIYLWRNLESRYTI